MASKALKAQAAKDQWFSEGLAVLKPMCAFSFTTTGSPGTVIDIESSARSLERSAAQWEGLFKEPSSRVSMVLAAAVVSGIDDLLQELRASLLQQSKSANREFRQSTEGSVVVVQAELETCVALVLELFHEAAVGGAQAVSSFQIASALKASTQLLRMFAALITELVLEEPVLVQGEWSNHAVTRIAGMSSVVRNLSSPWNVGQEESEAIVAGLGLKPLP